MNLYNFPTYENLFCEKNKLKTVPRLVVVPRDGFLEITLDDVINYGQVQEVPAAARDPGR